MRVGIPKEIKLLEGRVGLIPAACSTLITVGHEVFLEHDAGVQSGFSDAEYRAVGVVVCRDAVELYGSVEVIVKVKEPQPSELLLLRPHHLLFSYLHLAANLELLQHLQEIGLTAVGFETVEDEGLPLLAPMSDIAGRLAVQIGAQLLQRPQGGKGILLGGLPAAERGRVVILGCGVAGLNAARMAAAMGAEVVVFDRKRDRLEGARALGANVTALYAYSDQIARYVATAELLIGAVLVTGARAPHLVSAAQVATMQKGSVIIDISVDQGGCIETIRPTTYVNPTYQVDGVTHFGVTNIPGAVPRTASQALSAALIPYLQLLLAPGWREVTALHSGINLDRGEVVHPALVDLTSSL